MRRALVFLWLIALSACSSGGMQSQPQPQLPPMSASTERNTQTVAAPALASTNWNVGTGASYASYAVQALDFYPKSITIDAGDTISYHVASGVGGDAHTVSFVPAGQKVPSPGDPNDLKPAGGTVVDGTKFINSGILLGGQVFTLHFPKPGTYPILCLFHEPAMVSTVVVQKAGTPYPHNAQFYMSESAQDRWEDFSAGINSATEFPFAAYGTTIAAGIDPGLVHFPPPDVTILRFLNTPKVGLVATAGNKTIKAGTVLTWVNETSNEPHTVTFALAGQHDLPNIPPDPAVNVAPPPAITSFDGTRIVNSGTLLGNQKFLMKFTKPGSYFYGCLYHDNSRMVGTVTVTP